MNTCKHCGNQWTDGRAHCQKCGIRNLAMEKQTNGDRLRLMSDEVLARYIDVNMLPDRFLTDHYMKERAIDVILEWLKQEADQ